MNSVHPLSTFSLRCPLCRQETLDFPVGSGTGPKFCVDCKGIWFERGELARLVGTPQDVPEFKLLLIQAKITANACPSCKKSPLLETPYAVKPSPLLHWCNACGGIWLTVEDLSTLPALADKLRALVSGRKTKAPSVDAPASLYQPTVETGKIALLLHDTFRVNLFAFPFAVILCWLAEVLVVPAVILKTSTIWLHELGHATAAILGSRAAIPLPFSVTFTLGEKWWGVYALSLAVAGAIGGWAFKEKTRLPLTLMAVFVALQTYVTFTCDAKQSEFILVLGGIVGEFVFATLLVLAFYYRMPSLLRWNYWRFPCMVMGVFTLMQSFEQWAKGSLNSNLLPWGSLVGNDAEGDLNRLRDVFAWNAPAMTETFVSLGIACYLLICVHYVLFLYLSRPQNRRS